MIKFWCGFFVICVQIVILSIYGFSQTAPYPPSSYITNITWADTSEIVSSAPGSDSWPMTWADNDSLYTSWGDGWGFSVSSPKRSLGFARVGGGPQNPVGTDIGSPDEQFGNGRYGKKSSGMLMVNDTLWMWVRNANLKGKYCELWWSADHGKNWDQSSWMFTEFGYPVFINFGANYNGARDNYVYSVSHNNSSAYTPTDSFVLMRVDKNSLKDKNAYEFFSGTAENPAWSININDRKSVFTFPGECYRGGISFNSGIGRYIWYQVYDKGYDMRERGGIGVYEAAEPWGPWKTVYYSNDWDFGPGERGEFPTKWMSTAGDTMYLVFSGGDAFSVRRATLTVTPQTISVPIKVFLEGPYDSDGDSMRTALKNSLPHSQPFDSSPWNYVGSENIVLFPDSVVDWILVELRTDTTASSAVDSAAALLTKNGMIVDTSGSAPVWFFEAAGDYYLVLHHRNHLSIMSAISHALNNNSSLYDFTVSQNMAFGSHSMADLGGGIYGMYAGDANGDGQVQNDDKNVDWKTQVGMGGYRSADFNLNGQVQNDDKNVFWRNAVGLGTQVP